MTTFHPGKKYVRKDEKFKMKVYECRVEGHKYDGIKRLYHVDGNGTEWGIHVSMLARSEFKEIR